MVFREHALAVLAAIEWLVGLAHSVAHRRLTMAVRAVSKFQANNRFYPSSQKISKHRHVIHINRLCAAQKHYICMKEKNMDHNLGKGHPKRAQHRNVHRNEDF